jgi:2-polyprenyl-3-methyl-5-hydroxy-6-metoxy-1,4-benzoquinol methylase
MSSLTTRLGTVNSVQVPKDHDDPIARIQSKNPWYLDEQFKTQLGHPAYAAVVHNRWRTFRDAITTWRRAITKNEIRLLDAGCGDGINLLGLSNTGGTESWTCRISGIDYSPVRLQRAQSLSLPIDCVRGTLYEMPYGDGVFDIVLCNQVLEHIPNPQRALAELRRIVHAEGLVIIGVPNEGCLLARLRNNLLQPRISRTTDHVNFFTPRGITKYLKDAGLDLIRIDGEGFFFPHLRLHTMLGASTWGRRLATGLRTAFPSQAAGLIGLCRKGAGEAPKSG